MHDRFSQKELKDFEASLQKLKKEIEEDLSRTEDSTKPVKLDQQAVGRVSRIDAIQQQKMQVASFQRLKNRLALVERALTKVVTEDYGYCLKCE